jgi:hypothetical protein
LKKVLNGVSENIEISLLHKIAQQVLTHLTYIPIQYKENGIRIYGFAKHIQTNSGDPITVGDINNKDILERAQRTGNFGLWKYDVNQKEFSCSEQMCHIFGWDSIRISFESLLNSIHIDDRTKV